MSPARSTTSSAARPGRALRGAVARVLLAAGVATSLTACAGLLAPGAEPMPAPGIAPGVVAEAVPVELAPAPRPTSVGSIQGKHEQESAVVDVQPAPSGSASRGADRRPAPGAGDDAGPGGSGDAGDPGEAGGGPGGEPGGGAGGGGDDGGAEPDLTDSVQYAAALEAAVNDHRAANGLAALAHDTCAYDVALERAQALIGQELAHAPLDPIFQTCPTSAVAENLAKGGWTPPEAAQGWMDSEGHRANILNGGLTRGAVACVPDGGDPAAPVMICAHVFLG